MVAATPPTQAIGRADDTGPGGRTRLSPDHGGTSVVRSGRGGAGGHVPGQQRGGMHEQRLADAAGPTPPHDPTDARPEATLLEYPSVPIGPAEGRLPVPGVGSGVADVRLLGLAPH